MSADQSIATESARVDKSEETPMNALTLDNASWSCETFFEKYDAEQTARAQMLTGLDQPEGHRFRELGMEPVETVRIPAPANVLTTVGLNALTLRLITAAQVWDATHVGLAVGDSATAEAVGNTDLAGTGKYYQVLSGGTPTQANGVLTFTASYGSGVAEFAWNEYGAVVASGTGTAMAAGTPSRRTTSS